MRYCDPRSIYYFRGSWYQFNCLLDEYFKPILVYSILIILAIFIYKTFLQKKSLIGKIIY